MTVSNTNSTDPYTGNGSTTAFPITFDFYDDTDIEVIEEVIATGVETTKILNTDYTVSGGNGTTGSVEALSAPASTVTWTLRRVLPRTQTTDLPIAGNLPAASVEEMADRSIMLIQELIEEVDRCLQLPKSDQGATDANIPKLTANYLLVANSVADGFDMLNPSTLDTAVAYVNRLIDTFAGDGATKAFVLSADPGADGNVDVYKNGVHQENVEYVRSGATITFTTAPAGDGVTDNIEVRSGTAVAAGEIGVGAVEFSNIAASAISDDVTLAGDSSVELVTERAAKGYADSVAGGSTFADNLFRIQDNGDATKQIALEASGIATSTTRTITMPNADVDLTVVPNTSGTNTGDEPTATDTAEGVVELATDAETTTGTATDRAVTPANAASVYEPIDTDILRADTADTLTAGFATTVHDAGTKTTGTFTPDEANGNIQKAVNGGAHTLAPPTNDCTLLIQYTNNASAGAVTTSGFTLVDGDTISTTNADDFFFYITKANGFSLLTVKALQ